MILPHISSAVFNVQVKLFPKLLNFLGKPCRNMSKECNAAGNKKLNYNAECEKKVNDQINMELYASYVYLSLAYYFSQSSLSLNGFHKMFLFFSEEETEHARFFMSYQNLRGGKICLYRVNEPPNEEWSPKRAIQAALKLERDVTSSILKLHKCASAQNDPSLTSFLENVYIDEQYRAIDELYHLDTKLKRVADQEGLYILDKDLAKKYKPILKTDKS